jgi:hypothetical protein
VHDEPNHKHQFDNEYVWSYIAGFQPGETCKWHRHSEDSFYVALTGGQALNRPSDKEEFVHTMHQGDKWWSLYKNKPFVHQVSVGGSELWLFAFVQHKEILRSSALLFELCCVLQQCTPACLAVRVMKPLCSFAALFHKQCQFAPALMPQDPMRLRIAAYIAYSYCCTCCVCK